MLDSIYCSVGDHWFYSIFHNALWETTSALKRVYNFFTNHLDNTPKWRIHYKVEWVISDTASDLHFFANLCIFQYYILYRRSVCVTAVDLQDRGRLVFTSFLRSGHMNDSPSINHTVYQTGVQICSDSWHTTADPTSCLPLTFPFSDLSILSLFFPLQKHPSIALTFKMCFMTNWWEFFFMCSVMFQDSVQFKLNCPPFNRRNNIFSDITCITIYSTNN